MHDLGAVVPKLVISPTSENEVMETLRLLKELKLYKLDSLPISVKSGGHGYFNGASCSGIMINLTGMATRKILDDMLYLGPGCLLAHVIDALRRNSKAVPHGDCFGVGAGGHFLTAGWDLILARRYGLGCQSVVGGRVVLWDGSVIEVDENSEPELFRAMRGGAVAGVGVVTELRLRLIDEPHLVTWQFMSLSLEQLKICVDHNAFTNAFKLPNDISVSFRLYFEQEKHVEPVCSFNIASLLDIPTTLSYLKLFLGDEVTSLVSDTSAWHREPLLNLRMLPASEFLANNPDMLAEVTPVALHEEPEVYWKKTCAQREMASSYFTSISHWVVPECETMLLRLYEAFQSVQNNTEACKRMYALVIQGGGCMTQLAEAENKWSMPLGDALARFELHWDEGHEEKWCRGFTSRISDIIKTREDPAPGRPYRGDIWLEEQAKDPQLDIIQGKYDKRLV
ncbi:FAD-binding domain-containing protein [Cadophora sp. DSE1049]|nr:FAD-binding domain-containing protein [Cadophora sp. DSE1049]